MDRKTKGTVGFDDAVVWLKRANALSTPQLAKLFGVTDSTVSRWMHGHVRPSEAKLRHYEAQLGLPDRWLSKPRLPAPILKRDVEDTGVLQFPRRDGMLTPPLYHHRMENEVVWTEEEVRVVTEECEAILQRGIVAGELMGTRWGRTFLKNLWLNARDYCKAQEGGEPMADSFGAAVAALLVAEQRHKD